MHKQTHGHRMAAKLSTFESVILLKYYSSQQTY